MGIFRQFPYTNFHDLNLDWLLETVKEWVNKSDKYFTDTDEKIKYLSDNFDDLKEYVQNYFDNLDIHAEVAEILDTWLEDGTLEEILQGPYVMYDQFRQQFFDGNLVIRSRFPYETGAVARAIQNGCFYAPNGDYSTSDPANRIYTWVGSEDDSIIDLQTYNMNNELVNTLRVPNMAHGGCLTIKDSLMYSMNYEGLLTVFDISNSNEPVIIEQVQKELLSSYIIGANEFGFIGLKQDTSSHTLSVYQLDSNFENETFKYNLEGGIKGLFQDATVDTVNNRIYWVGYEPNVIHMHNYSDGSAIGQMVIPDIIGYVSVGEAEWIDVKNNHMYLGGFQGVGTQIDHNIDFKVWHTTPNMLGDNSRKIAINTAGYRDISVRYQTASGLNGNVTGLNGSVVFKYIEDAQLAAKQLNGAVRININEDYDESWQLHQDADYIFLNNSKTAAFVINANVIASVRGLTGFSGSPNTYDTIPTWILIRDNSRITFNNINELDVGTTNMLIYGVRCHITILSGLAELHNMALRSCVIEAVAGIGAQMHASGSIFDVPYLNAAEYNSQFLSATCVLRCRLQDGSDQRPTIVKLANGNLRSPAQFTFYPRSLSALDLYPLEPVFGYKSSDGATTLTMGMQKSGTWSTYSVVINRAVVTPRFATLAGTYYRYWLSNYSETYALVGVTNINS